MSCLSATETLSDPLILSAHHYLNVYWTSSNLIIITIIMLVHSHSRTILKTSVNAALVDIRRASTVPPPAPPRRRHIDGEQWQPVSECDAQLRGLERRFADALDDLRQDLHTTTRALAAEVQLDVPLLRVLVALWASRKLGAKHKHARKVRFSLPGRPYSLKWTLTTGDRRGQGNHRQRQVQVQARGASDRRHPSRGPVPRFCRC